MVKRTTMGCGVLAALLGLAVGCGGGSGGSGSDGGAGTADAGRTTNPGSNSGSRGDTPRSGGSPGTTPSDPDEGNAPGAHDADAGIGSTDEDAGYGYSYDDAGFPDGSFENYDSWSANAVDHRGSDGETYDYDCPAPGVEGLVWGTDTYTDDSSVCTAGVHAGAITMEAGGTVTIRIRPGESAYTGSTRNGVTTLDYEAWEGSYEIVP